MVIEKNNNISQNKKSLLTLSENYNFENGKDDKSLFFREKILDYYIKFYKEVYNNKKEISQEEFFDIRNKANSKTSEIFKKYLNIKDEKKENLTGFSINSGILVLNYKNGTKEYQNLIFSEEESKKYIEELKKTGKITIKSLGELRKETLLGVNKEILFGGGLAILYTGGSFSKTIYLKSCIIKLGNGISETINFKNGEIAFKTKEELKSNLFNILEKRGINYNPSTNSFEKFENKTSKLLIKEFKKIKYNDYLEAQKKEGGKILSKQEFDGNIKKLVSDIEKFKYKKLSIYNIQYLLSKHGFSSNQNFNKLLEKNQLTISSELKKIKYSDYIEAQKKEGGKILSKQEFETKINELIGKIKKNEIKIFNKIEIEKLLGKFGFGHIIQTTIFAPVFLRSYYSNPTDLASLGEGVSEWGLFELGAKAGSKINYGGIFGKIAFPIILGGLAVGIGKTAGSYLELDKKFWKYYPEREDYMEKNGYGKGKSVTVHIATLGAINDLGDKVSVNMPLYITETEVDLNTDIIGYMNSAIGRNSDFWNKRVDEYGERLTENIINAIKANKEINSFNKFYNNRISFLNIKKRIEKILGINGDELEKNNDIKQGIFRYLTSKFDSGNYNIDINELKLIINNYLENLKINDENIKKREEEQNTLGEKLIYESLFLNNNLLEEFGEKILNQLVDKLNKETNLFKSLNIYGNKKYWDKMKDKYFINKLLPLISKIGKEGELSNNCKKKLFEYLKNKFNSGNFNINKEELKGRILNYSKESIYIKGLNDHNVKNFYEKIFRRINNHQKMLDPDIILGKVSSEQYSKFLKNKSFFKEKNQYIGTNNNLMQKSEDKIMFEKLIESDIFLNLLNNMVEFKRNKDFIENIKKSGYAVEWHY